MTIFLWEKRVLFYEEGQIFELRLEKGFRRDLSCLFRCVPGVVSLKHLLFLKKIYPRKAKRYMEKLLKDEIEEFFPESGGRVYYQILEERENELEVSIWGYDERIAKELIKEGATHLIPESLLYATKEPKIHLLKREDLYVIIYSNREKILNFFTIKKLTSETLGLFLKGVKGHERIGWLIYGERLKEEAEPLLKDYKIETVSLKSEYPFLEFLKEIRLSPFWVKGFQLKTLDPAFILRILIYAFLSLSLNLYINNLLYQKALKALEEELKSVSGQSTQRESNATSLTYLQSVLEREQDPLYLLVLITKYLPQGSIIKKFTLSESNLDLEIETTTPFVLLNNLTWEKCFSTVKLTSPIIKEGDKFNLQIRIRAEKCSFQGKE